MNLGTSILSTLLQNEHICITFPNLNVDLTELFNRQCYNTLNKIKTVIENNSLSDFDCIEEIICIFEELDSECGSRHDF